MKLLMMKNKIYFLNFIILILFISCNNNDDLSNDWNKCMELYTENNFDNCIVCLNDFVENKSNSEYSAEAIYMISEIYLNEFKEYNISKSFLNQIISEYPDTETAKKALFTIAYINANYLELFTESIKFYSEFLKKYPDDDLIPSVKYELENLTVIQNTIDSLINVNQN